MLLRKSELDHQVAHVFDGERRGRIDDHVEQVSEGGTFARVLNLGKRSKLGRGCLIFLIGEYPRKRRSDSVGRNNEPIARGSFVEAIASKGAVLDVIIDSNPALTGNTERKR